MITDPRFAPARSDLPFLRRRARPKATPPEPPAARGSSPSPATAAPAAAPGTRPAAGGAGVDYHHRGNAAPAAKPATAPAPARSEAAVARPSAQADHPVDYHHRSGSAAGSLDLDDAAPAPAAPRPSAAQPSAPPVARPLAPSPGRPSAAAGSLDLSDPPPAGRVPAAPTPPPTWQQRHVVRVAGRQQQLMSIADPTVTLSRVQSGVGQLTIEAFCSPEIGDLRLGAAYTLRSGGTGIVQHADGNRFGPSSRRPVIVGSREEYERLGVDLRQTSDIERIAVFAYSESRAELTWGGTLVVTLFGGARLELPLERLYPGRIAMLMTFSNMHGELVARAEMETIAGDVREAARAYGFDRITWRDERSPVE